MKFPRFPRFPIVKVTAEKNTPTVMVLVCRREKGHSQYLGMSSKDNELVVHYDSEINRPVWGGCMVEETGLSTTKTQLDKNSETRKRLHNGGWEEDEILSQSRHGGIATHHAPAPSGGHGEHNRD